MTGFLRDTWILAGRAWRLTRTGPVLAGMILTPAVFLFGLTMVFSRLMAQYGIAYGQFLPPAVVAQTMLLTAMSTAAAVGEDRVSGVLARFRIMPVRAAAVPVARLAVEGTRAAGSVLVVVSLGYLIGFRLRTWPDSLLFVAVAVGFAMSLCLGTATMALAASEPESIVSFLYLPYLPLLTLSTAFAPAGAFPSWLQPVVRASPVSSTVNALRGLAVGDHSADLMLPAIAWIGGLLLVLGFAASRTFRRATG